MQPECLRTQPPRALSPGPINLSASCSPNWRLWLTFLKWQWGPGDRYGLQFAFVLWTEPSWVTHFLWTLGLPIVNQQCYLMGNNTLTGFSVRLRANVFARYNSDSRIFSSVVTSQVTLALITRFCWPVSSIFKTTVPHTLHSPPTSIQVFLQFPGWALMCSQQLCQLLLQGHLVCGICLSGSLQKTLPPLPLWLMLAVKTLLLPSTYTPSFCP